LQVAAAAALYGFLVYMLNVGHLCSNSSMIALAGSMYMALKQFNLFSNLTVLLAVSETVLLQNTPKCS